jgi:hypothetical protein
MAMLNLPLGVGKERTLCCRVVRLCVLGWVCGSFLGLSVFAWVLLRGVSLGFFSGSRVFFFFGFRGSWGFLGLVWVLFRGFYCIMGVTNGCFY